MNVRLKFATALNLLLPGSGLILARREWLGLTQAILFTTFSQVSIFGLWIAPAAIPGWALVGSVVAATATWCVAQWLLRRRLRVLSDPTISSQISTCHQLADAAIREGRLDDARGALNVALTVDDECLETNVRLARLHLLMGQFEHARKAWRLVEQLDRKRAFRREMVESLRRLPDAAC